MQNKLNHTLNLLRIDKNPLNDLGNPSGKIHRALLYISFSLLFIGCKLWVIYYYGNATPFWDQWDAEAACLYKPLFDDTLTFRQLFDHHNEHRIFTTRLLALLLIYINKTWNPVLQMVVNTGIHLMAALLLNALIEKTVGRKHLPALLAFSLILFCVPFGWENTLAGFQGQFYFVLIFSTAAIWCTVMYEPFSRQWWGGTIYGVLAFFSLASGLFAIATGVLLSLIFYFTNLRRTNKQLMGAAVLALLFIIGFLITPTLEHQEAYKAHTFPDFYHSMKIVFSWPISAGFLAAIIRNLPMAVFVVYLLRKRPGVDDRRWFLFALCFWSFIQVLLIAYGRAVGPMSPRYKDLHLIPVFVNFACLISLVNVSLEKWRNWAVIALGTWMGFVILSYMLTGFHQLPGELATKQEWNLAEEKNTKNYIATGNINYLKNKPEMYIPYPNADKLAMILELPGIREILPANIRGPLKPIAIESNAKDAFTVNGYNQASTPKYADSLTTLWGSYSMQRDSTVGELVLRFKIYLKGAKIEIPVAGYPQNKGMKLEIEQGGQRKPLVMDNPGESWNTAYTRIKSNDFSIHISDSSTTAWIAIGAPVVLGNLDNTITRLLSHYYSFLVLGIIIVLFLIILTGLNNQKQNL